MSYEKRREKELKKFVRQCRIELEEERYEVFKKQLECSHKDKGTSIKLSFYDSGLVRGLNVIRQIERML